MTPAEKHRYRSAGGTEIVLVTPWGAHSGMIPPPVIEFHTDAGPIAFVYIGSNP